MKDQVLITEIILSYVHIIMISYISLPSYLLRTMVDGERFTLIRAGGGSEKSGRLWISAFTRISQDPTQSQLTPRIASKPISSLLILFLTTPSTTRSFKYAFLIFPIRVIFSAYLFLHLI